MRYKISNGGVVELDEGLVIPDDPGNRHWREYQKWLKAGGQPEAADVIEAPVDVLTAEELFDMVKAKGVVGDVDRPRQRRGVL